MSSWLNKLAVDDRILAVKGHAPVSNPYCLHRHCWKLLAKTSSTSFNSRSEIVCVVSLLSGDDCGM